VITQHPDQSKRNQVSRTNRERQSQSALSKGGSQEARMAQALGWFGIVLGLAEVAVPGGLTRLMGVRSDHRTLIRTLGLREIASGIGILTQRAPVGAVWSRVGGDAVDLACLGMALVTKRAKPAPIIAATAAVAGVAALDILCAQRLSRHSKTNHGLLPVKVSLAINRSQQELYQFWRDFENLPSFMAHLVSVTKTEERRSHWVAKGLVGETIEWDADIVEDRPNELIAWRSIEGADVDHSGSVRFEPAPGGRQTLVTVEMQYRPLGGTLGASVATLFGKEPNQTVKRDLRRFKQVMETGEVITTEGQPAGRASSISWKYDQAVR
jgi:uncharacterized membrane protein